MADYVSKYTGAQIDEAVGKALAGGTVTADSIKNALGYTPADKTVTDTLTNKVATLEKEVANGITDEDKAAIALQVLDMIEDSTAQVVVDDSSKSITLSGDLADGAYTLKYLNSDGSTSTIATLTISGGTGEGSGGTEEPEEPDNPVTPTYTNLVPTALTHTDRSTVFNGTGYKDGAYASSSSPYYGSDSATVCTGAIPASADANSVYYIKGITLDASANAHCRVGVGQAQDSAAGNGIVVSVVKAVNDMSAYATLETLSTQYYKLTILASYVSANTTRQPYFFLSGIGTGANLIITAGEPIE